MRRAGSSQRWGHIKIHCPTQRVADSGWKDLLSAILLIGTRMLPTSLGAVDKLVMHEAYMLAVYFNMVKRMNEKSLVRLDA